MEHSADYDAGRITPEGRARLDKYGSTLDAGNVRLLCERIADYPEVLAAAAGVLADEWQVGGWSKALLPKPEPPAVPVIAYANRVTDWLRGHVETRVTSPDKPEADA